MMRDRVCLFCLAPEAMSVKFDRRGKPFLRCYACGVRAFMPSLQALNGVAILTPYAESVVDRMAHDPTYASAKRQEVATMVDAIRARLTTPVGAPSAPIERTPALSSQGRTA